MTTVLTFDEPAGARRPTVDDVGGADFENDPENPPDPTTMPAAEGWNQKARLVEAFGKVVPVAIVSVRFTAGVPFVYKAIGPGGSIIPSLFTLTDNGTGDTTLTWPVGTLPPGVVEPVVTLNASGAAAAWNAPSVTSVTNGVRVITPLGGAGADLPFTVQIF